MFPLLKSEMMTVRSVNFTVHDYQYYLLSCAAVVIGFLNTSYTVNENDGAANIQIGVIQGSLERSVVVRFSTSADSASGKLHELNMHTLSS